MNAMQAEIALRAIKTVATNDGATDLTGFHRGAIAAFQSHISASAFDVDALATISPDELALAIPDVETRNVAIYDLAYAAMIDPDLVGDESRMELVERFAAALEVRPSILKALRHAVRQQRVFLQIDALRMFLATLDAKGWTDKLRQLWNAVAPFLGVTDAAKAARYRALEAMPRGTLGRTYYEFVTSRNLPFPGEKHGAPEHYFVPHDLVHCLAGYGTDRDGEVQIIGFEAGYRKRGGLDVILLALCQVQLGMVIDPVAPALRGELDFDKLLAAYRRGSQIAIDFSDSWDYWAVFDRPIDELRARYELA